jgi:hypothetical protein
VLRLDIEAYRVWRQYIEIARWSLSVYVEARVRDLPASCRAHNLLRGGRGEGPV